MAATTTPDGIVYPTLTDAGDDIPAVLAALANSVQTALTNMRNAATIEGRATRTGTGAITSGTVPLPMQSLIGQTGGVSLVSGGLRVPTAGLYMVTAFGSAENAASNTYRDFMLQVGGTTVSGSQVQGGTHPSSDKFVTGGVNWLVRLAANDVVTLASVSGQSGTMQPTCRLGLVRVGA